MATKLKPKAQRAQGESGADLRRRVYPARAIPASVTVISSLPTAVAGRWRKEAIAAGMAEIQTMSGGLDSKISGPYRREPWSMRVAERRSHI